MSKMRNFPRLFILVLMLFTVSFSGCSYLPWGGDDEEDLAFEDDALFEEEAGFENQGQGGGSEDDFFADEGGGGRDGGFASVEPSVEVNEVKQNVESLQQQQVALIGRVRELDEQLRSLEPRVDATQQRLEGSLSTMSEKSEFLEPEVDDLRNQIAKLNEEITVLKAEQVKIQSAPKVRAPARRRSGRGGMRIPQEYKDALAAYKRSDYNNSILLFQNYATKNPPVHLQDNIAFWIGTNYYKLKMFDDAIRMFQTVESQFPRGNKVHDSRYMLGSCYLAQGDRARASDVLEAALRGNPPRDVRAKIEKKLGEL